MKDIAVLGLEIFAALYFEETAYSRNTMTWLFNTLPLAPRKKLQRQTIDFNRNMKV